MKFFVTFCILITLQLRLIRASEVEEQNVEELHVEGREDNKSPICEANEQLAGQCLYPAKLLNKSCDFIKNDILPLKPFICGAEEYCCVDCNVPRLNATCHLKTGDNNTASRRTCCPGEFGRELLISGCRCCGKCKRTRRCKRKGGFCVSKYDEKLNYDYCTALNGNVNPKLCKGSNCGCCVIKDTEATTEVSNTTLGYRPVCGEKGCEQGYSYYPHGGEPRPSCPKGSVVINCIVFAFGENCCEKEGGI